jgi:hypothetical protein
MHPLHHPIYVSVTEIEHQPAEKQLEITCRIFTNDLEAVLKSKNERRIDLLNPKLQPEMEKIVQAYINEHLKIFTNGKQIPLKYLGYEQEDDAIQSYLTAPMFMTPTNLTIINDLLFEYKREQTNIVYLTVNNKRAGKRLSNPEKQFVWKTE